MPGTVPGTKQGYGECELGGSPEELAGKRTEPAPGFAPRLPSGGPSAGNGEQDPKRECGFQRRPAVGDKWRETPGPY